MSFYKQVGTVDNPNYTSDMIKLEAYLDNTDIKYNYITCEREEDVPEPTEIDFTTRRTFIKISQHCYVLESELSQFRLLPKVGWKSI